MAFLDFQMARVGNPIYDIAYYYYCCTSKDVFDKLETNQRVYYDSFSRHLRLLGCDPDVLYSYETFLKDWRRHARFGLFCSLMLIRLMLSDQSEAPDMTKAVEEGKEIWDAFNYTSTRENECEKRIRDIVHHMMTNGF